MLHRLIILLAVAAVVASGCAHGGGAASEDEKPTEKGEASEQEAETLDDALRVDLDELGELDDEAASEHASAEAPDELDDRFWESRDGISGDAVFGEAAGETAGSRAAPDQPAPQAVRDAHVAARAQALTAAILDAPPEQVEQILAWRRQLREIDPGAQHARHAWVIHTIQSGVDAAVADRDWERVVELQELYKRRIEAFAAADIAPHHQLDRTINGANAWLVPAFAAALFHVGELERARDSVAVAIRDRGVVDSEVALRVAERLHAMDVDQLSREIVAGPLEERLDEVPNFHRKGLAVDLQRRAIELVGRISADDDTKRTWAGRFLRSRADAGSGQFFAAGVSLCREALGEPYCLEVRSRVDIEEDPGEHLRLVCAFYEFRRDTEGLDAARRGFEAFVDACDGTCREALEDVRFQSAVCSRQRMSAEPVPGVAEVLFAIPLQAGDVDYAMQVLDAQPASALSKALVALSVRPANLLLRDPAERVALVEAAIRWLDASEQRLGEDPDAFPSVGNPRDVVAELRIQAAEMYVEAGLSERARGILREVRVDPSSAPRLLVRAVEMLVGMGASQVAADLLIAHLNEQDRRHLQQWVAPVARKLAPRQALRVYRAAASAGYAGMSKDGLMLAVSENDPRTAAAIVDAFGDDVEPMQLLGVGAETELEEAARNDPRWAQFYLQLLRSKPPARRSRYERVRLARVLGQAGEPDEALEDWTSLFEQDELPCAALSIALRDGPGADVLEAMIELDQPAADASANRLMASLMLHMRMRRADGDPVELEPRYRSRVTSLTRQILARSPMVCASPIGFADIMAGHGFPEAALEILDQTRARGFERDRNGHWFEPIRQRFLEMRVALDIDDIPRAERAIERVERNSALRRALQRELGWYLLETGREELAAEYLDKSLFSLGRLYVDEAVRRTSYDPLSRWRSQRSSIDRVDDTVVALARVRVDQGRAADFVKKLEDLQARSTVDEVRKRRLALRLLPLFEDTGQGAAVIEVLDATGMNDRLWMIGARAEIASGEVDRGFAKLDIRASKVRGSYGFWLDQAYWLIDRGQLDAARRAMERARRIGGDGPGLAVARGRIALLGGDDDTVLAEFRAALEQLHLRTTVEHRVRDALEAAMREDLIARLASDGLLEQHSGDKSSGGSSGAQLNTLDLALKNRRPADALRVFLELEDELVRRGQLALRARAVAELVAATEYPHEDAFQQVIIEHELSQAALTLARDVGLRGDPTKSSDAFRLWAFLTAGVERRGIELALEMLDPVSPSFDPDTALRLVAAHGRRDELRAAARSGLARDGMLAGAAPYLLDTRLVGAALDSALDQFAQTSAYVDANRDVLTSAQLRRWSLMQARLVRHGLRGEAAAILGRPPADARLVRDIRGADDEQQQFEAVWRDLSIEQMALLQAEHSGRLPGREALARRSLGGLASRLMRASAVVAREVVDDPRLAARLEASPGHLPARVAWIVTLFEAGEVERARQRTRAYLEQVGRDGDAVSMLVSHLGERGLWVELARVVEPSLEDGTITEVTARWIERAHGELGMVSGPGIERDDQRPAVRAAGRVLGRPLAVDALVDAATSAGGAAHIGSANVLDAIRELGPLEQWCYAPKMLGLVLELARVHAAPELNGLERCAPADVQMPAPSASASASRLEAYRQGVRRGLLSPRDFDDYRVLRWRHD